MNLHVEVAGAGKDLVMLHGWGLHSGAWAEVLPALCARARVHAIDLPGHGYSASVEAASFDAAVDAVAQAMPPGSILCGWSLGGLIAQAIAHRHPGRVSRLALVASTPCFAQRPGWPHGMAAATLEQFAGALANDRDAMLKRFVALNAMHAPHGREAVRAFTRRLLDRGTPSDAGLAATLEWLRTVDLREPSARLALPTLVIHGRRDMIAPVGAGRWLAQNIADARFIELPEAAHMPFFSHGTAFVSALGEHVG
jgi:pimeloyl-[acyl-carrier protein] methyl ester esterase